MSMFVMASWRDADASGQRRLTRSPGYDGDPAWWPDGRKIAFASGRNGNGELYVMNADGSGQRNLTRSQWDEEMGLPGRPRGRNRAATNNQFTRNPQTHRRDGSVERSR
jgi:Tol biopolymer transport system component